MKGSKAVTDEVKKLENDGGRALLASSFINGFNTKCVFLRQSATLVFASDRMLRDPGKREISCQECMIAHARSPSRLPTAGRRTDKRAQVYVGERAEAAPRKTNRSAMDDRNLAELIRCRAVFCPCRTTKPSADCAQQQRKEGKDRAT